MTKLTTILEKIEKINVEKIITDLTDNSDEEIINDYVMSKKKDDRIAIAANPNLTPEHFEKLANDKVNSVKQALCYNANLPANYAQVLLDEEPERLKIIAEYCGKQIDNILIPFIKDLVKEKDYMKSNVVSWLGPKPTISDKLYQWLLDNFDANDLDMNGKELQRRKDIPNKLVKAYLAKMMADDSDSYGGATRIILNHPYFTAKVVSEMDITNPIVQKAILFRNDSSKKVTINAIEHINPDATGSITSIMRDGENKWKKDKDVLNAWLKMGVEKFGKKITSFTYDTSIIGNVKGVDGVKLDSELLMKAATIAYNGSSNSNKGLDIEPYVTNLGYPSDGFSNFKFDSETIKTLLSAPNIPEDLIRDTIKNLYDNEEAEAAMWGLTTRKKSIPKDIQWDLKKKLEKQVGYFYTYIARDEVMDEILENISDYAKDMRNEYGPGNNENLSNADRLEAELLKKISANSNIKSTQADTVIKHAKKFNKGLPDYQQAVTEPNLITNNNADPKFMDKLFKRDKDLVWQIWIQDGSTYFQYNEGQRKVIDAAIMRCKTVPDHVVYNTFNRLNKDSYTKWVKYANQNGGMDDKKALKYLLKFLELAKTDNELKEKFTSPNYIDGIFIENSDVLAALYELTNDDKYLPDEAKDIFLF